MLIYRLSHQARAASQFTSFLFFQTSALCCRAGIDRFGRRDRQDVGPLGTDPKGLDSFGNTKYLQDRDFGELNDLDSNKKVQEEQAPLLRLALACLCM
jgi:hypothetical protein